MEKVNLTLLGAPIFPEAIDDILQPKLDDLILMVERLKTIDAHDALFLLKSAYAIPKLMYFIRSAPTFKNMETLALYDEVLRQGLQEILNVELEGDQWLQSSLPVRRGGLGIRKATDLASAAYLSSAYGALSGCLSLLPSHKTLDTQRTYRRLKPCGMKP